MQNENSTTPRHAPHAPLRLPLHEDMPSRLRATTNCAGRRNGVFSSYKRAVPSLSLFPKRRDGSGRLTRSASRQAQFPRSKAK